MHFLFLNQFIPPDPAPTARLLGDLATHLEQQGHTVQLISSGQTYRQPGASRVGRYLRETTALLSLFRQGLSGPRPDVVLSLTSPPCLLIPATLLALLRGARSVHWIMDLYPEIAVALGEIRSGFLFRTLRGIMGLCYRRAALVVVLDEDMAEKLRGHGVEPGIVRPWISNKPQSAAGTGKPPDHPWCWLYSGNLGRGHEWQTLLDAQHLLEKRGAAVTLVFQGGGASRKAAQAEAERLDLRFCLWADYLPEEKLAQSLQGAGALIVTQKPEVKGLLWPSKLASAIRTPRPVLWVGPVDGCIAEELQQRPGAGIFQPGNAAGVADWVGRMFQECPTIPLPPEPDHKAQALAQWTTWLEKLKR